MTNEIGTCACPVCGSWNAVVIFDDRSQVWECGKGCQTRPDEDFHIMASATEGNFLALLAQYVDTTVHTPVWTTKAKSMSHAMQLFWSHRNAT